MNKFKSLFLLVFCLILVAGATNVGAQTGGDKVLVSGKNALRQSDIDGMIKFYEWIFEAEFTADQRRRFQKYTENEFRSNPAEHRQTVNDIINTLPKILAADENVQQETRKNLLAALLPIARKSSDENSRMLVGIYEAAHNGESNVVANISNNSEDSTAARGDVSDLVGKWVWGRTGSSTVTTGGAYVGSNGSRFTYQFLSNGTVEYTGIMNVMTGGCTMQVFKTMKGKARLSGSTLTIDWSPASFSRDDSCDRAGNYKKTLPAETQTFKVNFKDSYNQKQLCLTEKEETCFSPTN